MIKYYPSANGYVLRIQRSYPIAFMKEVCERNCTHTHTETRVRVFIFTRVSRQYRGRFQQAFIENSYGRNDDVATVVACVFNFQGRTRIF